MRISRRYRLPKLFSYASRIWPDTLNQTSRRSLDNAKQRSNQHCRQAAGILFLGGSWKCAPATYSWEGDTCISRANGNTVADSRSLLFRRGQEEEAELTKNISSLIFPLNSLLRNFKYLFTYRYKDMVAKKMKHFANDYIIIITSNSSFTRYKNSRHIYKIWVTAAR